MMQRSIVAERVLRESLRLQPSLLLSFDIKEVDDFAFTPDSKNLVIAANDTIRVISTGNLGELIRFPFKHKPSKASQPRFIDESEAPFLHAFNDYIVLSTEGTVEIRDIMTGSLILDRIQISLATVSEPGNYVAWYDKANGKIEIWFGGRPQETTAISLQGDLSALFFSPAENYLAAEHSGGKQTWWGLASDGKVAANRPITPRIVDKSTQGSIRSAARDRGFVAGSAPDWRYLLVSHATETDEGTRTLWSVVEPLKGRTKLNLPPIQTDFASFKTFFTSDGKHLVAWYDQDVIWVWDTSEWEIRIRPEGIYDYGWWRVDFDPTGIVYLERNEKSRISTLYKITDSVTGEVAGPIQLVSNTLPPEAYDFNVFSADGRFVAVSVASDIRVFSTSSGREIAREGIGEEKHARFVDLSPNGRFLVIGESVDQSSGEDMPRILRLFLNEPDTMQFTGDNNVRKSYNGCVIPWPDSIDSDVGTNEQKKNNFYRRYVVEQAKYNSQEVVKITEKSTSNTVWKIPDSYDDYHWG